MIETNHDSRGKGAGFAIGGVVYEDPAKPLMTGLQGIAVKILDDEGRAVASTVTAGLMGLWSVEGLPAGQYSVVFVGAGDGISGWREVIKIAVNAENEAANQSLQLLRKGDASRRPAR